MPFQLLLGQWALHLGGAGRQDVKAGDRQLPLRLWGNLCGVVSSVGLGSSLD